MEPGTKNLEELNEIERATVEKFLKGYVMVRKMAPPEFRDAPEVTEDEMINDGLKIVLGKLDRYVERYKKQLDKDARERQ